MIATNVRVAPNNDSISDSQEAMCDGTLGVLAGPLISTPLDDSNNSRDDPTKRRWIVSIDLRGPWAEISASFWVFMFRDTSRKLQFGRFNRLESVSGRFSSVLGLGSS